MRRPCVVLFLGFSAGCLWVWYGGLWGIIIIAALFLAAGWSLFSLKSVKKESRAVVFFMVTAALFGAAVMGAELFRAEPLLSLAGEKVEIVGTVVMEKSSFYGRSLLLRPEGETLSRRRIWVVLKETDGKKEPWGGRKLRIGGIVEAPQTFTNPGGFDQRIYLRTLGAKAVVRTEKSDIDILDFRLNWPERIRWKLKQRWEPIMGSRSFGGLMSLVFGASDAMEEETLDAFRRVGLGHLLAVSGLHVGLLYSAVQTVMKEHKNSPLAQMICALAAVLYAALAGFSPSASRAALMMVIHSLGRALKRPYDMTTSVSLAGLLLLLVQPCQLMSGGFQLSLLAAFGMACVRKRISYSLEHLADRKRSKKLQWLAQKGAAAGTIELVMGPICARRFHNVCLFSPLLNPLCIAAAGMILPMAMGLMALTVISETIGAFQPLFFLFCRLTGRMMEGMMNLGEAAALLPGSFTIPGPPEGALLLYYGGLFTWSSERFFLFLRKGHKKIAVFWVAALIISGCVLPFWTGTTFSFHPFSYPGCPMVFVDVGQGDCLHIKTPGGKHILIDGGGSAFRNVGKNVLLPYLLHCGVSSVDLALATHLHTDHVQGLWELAEEIPIKRLGMYEANAFQKKKAFDDEERIVYLKEGDRIEIEPELWIDVLAPPGRSKEEYQKICADESDENASCLVFMVHYKGLKTLVTGDLGIEGERDLLYQNRDALKAHILKVGHHGSKYSTSEEFLKAANPRLAVISVGSNHFGHPSKRVIELLEKNDIIIGRTDRHGALMVKKIGRRRVEVVSGNGEKTWHINLKTKNTPIRKSKDS